MSPETQEALEAKIKAIVIERLGLDESEVEVNSGSSFVDDLGADSLDMVELVMAFEDAFDIEIRDEDAQDITTFGEAVTYMVANMSDSTAA